jgi:ketol-acid reductoisomerase
MSAAFRAASVLGDVVREHADLEPLPEAHKLGRPVPPPLYWNRRSRRGDVTNSAEHSLLFTALRPGTTLGLSHGFLVGHLRQSGADFPEGISVVAVCPKGIGDSVRRLYVQGAQVNCAGINSSVAVHRDHDGRAVERALAWSVGLGAPYTFGTTLDNEYRSDIVGERAVLLGAVHGLVESLYQRFRLAGDDPHTAYERSCENVTGPIARTISADGLAAVRDRLDPAGQDIFDRAYTATYQPALDLIAEIYDEVDSGNELRSVVLAAQRLANRPMAPISGSPMWAAGPAVRTRRAERDLPVEPFTAGAFLAMLTAQVDLLAERSPAVSHSRRRVSVRWRGWPGRRGTVRGTRRRRPRAPPGGGRSAAGSRTPRWSLPVM